MLTNDYQQVWDAVQAWPPDERLALASRLIQSLKHEHTQSGVRVARPADLIGIWKSVTPPSDDEVERILEEERLRKFG